MMGRYLNVSLSTSGTRPSTAPRSQELSVKPPGCKTVFVGNLSTFTSSHTHARAHSLAGRMTAPSESPHRSRTTAVAAAAQGLHLRGRAARVADEQSVITECKLTVCVVVCCCFCVFRLAGDRGGPARVLRGVRRGQQRAYRMGRRAGSIKRIWPCGIWSILTNTARCLASTAAAAPSSAELALDSDKGPGALGAPAGIAHCNA